MTLRATKTYRRMLIVAMLLPFVLWGLIERYDLNVDWRYTLPVPLAIAGFVVVEAWQQRSPNRVRIAVLAAPVLAFWLLALVLNVPNTQ
jgi:hypothetical protein